MPVQGDTVFGDTSLLEPGVRAAGVVEQVENTLLGAVDFYHVFMKYHLKMVVYTENTCTRFSCEDGGGLYEQAATHCI